ncbi:hypothetical protein D0Z00_003895 [Geotrichum galactomycetum]|uniref:Uncharacterized protein n=1 Tax=Geotrichum galactomycetum TaxID=27317 RepID=A0ACB6V093_9ASCO|nr:hypothetical protein D0Z00_003895 [Geotrichum candidum]
MSSTDNKPPLPQPGDTPSVPEPAPAALSDKNGLPDEFFDDEQHPLDLTPKALKFKQDPSFRDLRPDFVIDVGLAKKSDSEPFNLSNVNKLVTALKNAGLYIEIRQGSASSLLVFVKCSAARLTQQFYHSATKDWLYTISTTPPSEWNNEESPDLTPAQKLRLIYSILTAPPSDHGLGITPQIGEWYFVNSIFPLHNHELNKQWIRRWSTKWVIDAEDINWIRNHFGEKYALYFAFLQDYILWLIFPTVIGLFTYLFLGSYSKFFGVLNIAWGVLFVQAWKRKESSLAFEWGVKGSSILETPRPQFIPESFKVDPISNEKRGYYPNWKRALKQLAFIPLALGAILVVIILQMLSFSLEILIGQLYHGPFKSYLSLIPTGVLVAVIPVAVSLYSNVVAAFNDWENHETEDSHEISFTQKLFSLSFLTSSGGLLLTAYLYLPFGHLLKPHVDNITIFCQSWVSNHFASPERFEVNSNRLQQQVLYLMGTAQVIKFAVSTVLPYVQRKTFSQAQRITSKEANPFNDDPEEVAFLEEVREQAKEPEHSVQPEYQEMVLQFSHIMLYGVVWPLAPLAALINNWIELRGDAVKICVDMRRPIPSRAESIGPWLLDLKIITWLASIVMSSLLAMFADTHAEFSMRSVEGLSLVNSSLWKVLAFIIVFEHGYFIWSFAVSFVVGQLSNKNQIKDKQARHYLRKISLQEEGSPVTVTGDLKNLKISTVNPSEAVWKSQERTETILLEEAKEILHRVKEINNPTPGETKKTK